MLPAPHRLLNLRHVDLAHVHHGVEGAFGFFSAFAERVREDPWRDLPGDAPLVLAPAAGALLPAVADDGVPVAVGLRLVGGVDHEGKRLVVGEGRAAVEADAGDAQHRELHQQGIALLAGGIVIGRVLHGPHLAVREETCVETGGRLGVLVVPEADGCCGHGFAPRRSAGGCSGGRIAERGGRGSGDRGGRRDPLP